MTSKKEHSKEFIKKVLETFVANNNNYRKTVRETGVSYPTLKKWVSGETTTAKKAKKVAKKTTKKASKKLNLVSLVEKKLRLEDELATLKSKIIEAVG